MTLTRCDGDETVIVVGPACDPAVFGVNHGSPMQRDWNPPTAVAKSWFYEGCLKRPFGKRVRATHKRPFSLQEGVRVEFARLPKKFCQSVLCFELQSDPVVFETELVGESCDCILYVALIHPRDNRQHYLV